MIQKQFDLATYIIKHQQGELTVHEQQILDSWLAESDENPKLFAELNDEAKVACKLMEFRSISKGFIWDKTILLLDHANIQVASSKAKFINWHIWLGAAAAVVIVALGFVFYTHIASIDQTEIPPQLSEIKPGGIGATLTLSDGRQLDVTTLSGPATFTSDGVNVQQAADGLLTFEIKEGINIPSREKLKMNTLKTSKGQTIRIKLADGSVVWLNAASSLVFPSYFSGKDQRIVQLSGEGYFEVSKNKSPFIVQTLSHKVRVLGTHFNIDAYEADHGLIKTTLLEGSVEVGSGMAMRHIQPGQRATWNNGQVRVQQANIEADLAWKNGDFQFSDNSLSQILNAISRWYDIEIEYAVQPKSTIRFEGELSRNSSIDDVIHMLEATGEVKFERKGRRIILIK